MKQLLFSLFVVWVFIQSGCKDSANDVAPVVKPIEPGVPVLMYPASDSVYTSSSISLRWIKVDSTTSYQLQLAKSAAFTTVDCDTIIAQTYCSKLNIKDGTYYWRVRSIIDTVKGNWSTSMSFKVILPEVIVNEPIPANSKVIKLSSTPFKFVEGPVWDGVSTWYFSDIDANTIYSYSAAGGFKPFMLNSNGSNGLMFDKDGRLLSCQGNSGKIVAIDKQGVVVETVVSTYNSKRLNRPNDLVIDKQGGIYFTDPSWDSSLPQGLCGVYYRANDGTVTRLVSDMKKPNGIILSIDNTKLFIGDSESTVIRMYPISSPGVIGERVNFASLQNSSGSDGVALDEKENLYVACFNKAVQIFDKTGKYISSIAVPEGPTNCDFGGSDLKTLLITAQKNVYSIQLNYKGITFPIK